MPLRLKCPGGDWTHPCMSRPRAPAPRRAPPTSNVLLSAFGRFSARFAARVHDGRCREAACLRGVFHGAAGDPAEHSIPNLCTLNSAHHRGRLPVRPADRTTHDPRRRAPQAAQPAPDDPHAHGEPSGSQISAPFLLHEVCIAPGLFRAAAQALAAPFLALKTGALANSGGAGARGPRHYTSPLPQRRRLCSRERMSPLPCPSRAGALRPHVPAVPGAGRQRPPGPRRALLLHRRPL